MRDNSTLLFGTVLIILSLFFSPFAISGATGPIEGEDKVFTIVLDPGHGGTDHGGISRVLRKRIREKDVTLAIARKIGVLLENSQKWQKLGKTVKVVYTRNRDTTVSLEERVKIVKSVNAQLLVSIHANADKTGRARGIETYFLNNTTAQASRKLEQISRNERRKRNGPEGFAAGDVGGSGEAAVKAGSGFGSGSGVDDGDGSGDGGEDGGDGLPGNRPVYRETSTDLLLRSVRADAMITLSKQAAKSIQTNVIRSLRKAKMSVFDRGIKQDILYVLLDSGTPAILFEAPFLTNKHDVKNLLRESYQAKIAEGVANGILEYAETAVSL